MVRPATIPPGNNILDSLPASDRAALVPDLEAERLELKQALFEPGKRLDHAYFPITAVVSLLNLVEDEVGGVEVATVGNEGLLGLPLSWGATVLNPSELVQAQVPGEALVMDAEAFANKLGEGGALRGVVNRYTQAFVSQIAQQVACNGLHSIEERCARWLLLTRDRVGTEDFFPLTQEFLAQMLGVRRPSVTVVAGVLQEAGFIRVRRGRITITDPQGLESASCECYHVLREIFDRLVRPSPVPTDEPGGDQPAQRSWPERPCCRGSLVRGPNPQEGERARAPWGDLLLSSASGYEERTGGPP